MGNPKDDSRSKRAQQRMRELEKTDLYTAQRDQENYERLRDGENRMKGVIVV